jgi:hypothetical protein
MWRPRREDRLLSCRYKTARVELSCPATTAHARSWILEDATIYADMGRQHHADMMGGQTGGARPLRAWTVSFTHGEVVGWTE